MNRIERLKVLWLNTYIGMFVIIAMVYGVLFGGPTVIFNTETTIETTILTIIASTFAYFSLFLLATVAIYIAINSKVLLSFGIARKDAVKIWSDLILYGTLFVSGFIWLFFLFIFKEIKPVFGTRYFNINMMNISVLDSFKLLVFIIIFVFMSFMAFSFITSVGGKHGVLSIIGMVTIVIAIGGFMIPLIEGLVVWGDKYLELCLGMGVVSVILWLITRKHIINMEVRR